MRLTHPVLAFFGLTFLISGAAAAPLIASLHGFLPVAVPPFLGLAAAVGPGIAALAITIREDGWPGAWRLLGSALRWRVGLAWYLVALLFAPIMLAVSFALNAWLGAPFPSLANRLPGLLPLFLMLTLQTGFGEELGWRGFAQRRLQATLSPLRAALLVGIVWSLWHLPLFLIPGSMQWQLWRAGGMLAAVGGYAVYLLFTAVLYALLMNASGSVLMPMLLHGSTNATAWLFSLNEVEEQGVRPMLLFTTLQAVLVTAWLFAGRTLTTSRRLTSA
jgi:membrane protease YdiL (CAAX protease family)